MPFSPHRMKVPIKTVSMLIPAHVNLDHSTQVVGRFILCCICVIFVLRWCATLTWGHVQAVKFFQPCSLHDRWLGLFMAICD